MKRLLLPIGRIAILAVLAVAYGVSAYSWSTSHLSVSLVERDGGHQAILKNTGILPVKVVGCEFISDTNERNPVIVGDVIQRELPNDVWESELVRNRCEEGKSRTHCGLTSEFTRRPSSRTSELRMPAAEHSSIKTSFDSSCFLMATIANWTHSVVSRLRVDNVEKIALAPLRCRPPLYLFVGEKSPLHQRQ